ncbi:SagB/ThcOx family dehydrogenase [Streptomyces sp. UNOC14_S4]|uniref:SagB/ThcOx family dehydrogenase n=1 Tax=Streptomyces sp. UNOC14_S4 TaxID=2872340 RepID=UPI001E415257|nr:SagB/ThcOx family dehydrogenase [Streptomyces sp. UNOC14_S4]MCC3770091.1 SagB/ThcOx family dehydrogenase [Streptomyces sp. UNOC14_S4]
MTAGAVGLVESLGFAVRELPLPARLDGTAFALVRAEHRAERLEQPAAPVPTLTLAAGRDPDAARWRLAARAAELRLGRADGYGYGYGVGVGAGADIADAVRDAVCDAVERRDPPATASRLTGWTGAVPSPLHPELDAELTCYAFDSASRVPLVGAVLRQDAPPREIRALGCAPTARAALARALDGILTRAAADLWTEPAASPAVRGDIGLDEVEAVPEKEFGSRVHAAVRTVHDSDSDSGAVVQCRLVSGPGGAAEPPGPWAPPGIIARRTAPADLSLACDPERVRISRTFHENSKIRAAHRTLPPVDVDRLHPDTRRALARPYRDYGRTRTEHPLPKAAGRDLLPLDEAVRRRRSAAPMSRAPLALADLARVLDLSAGITGVAQAPDGVRLPLRATPTAGGLCSGDLFVLAHRVEDLNPGVHYFHPGRRVLQCVNSGRDVEGAAAYTGYPDRVAGAAAVVLHVAAFRRNQWKYGERGYRMALLECGHLAQSVVTAAAALGLVAHPVVGFVDDHFDRLVGVNGTDDAVVHLTLLGGAVS